MLKILVLGLLHTASALVDDQPYCSLRYRRLCQGKGRHVACQYPVPGPGPSCQNYTQIRFTSELQSFIVHYINKRRQRIASGNERVRGGTRLPRPQIMMLVSWDRELAKLAQRLADQCQFVHDDCRATVRYPYAGQSVGEVRWRNAVGEGVDEAVSLGVQRALRRVLDAWWGERRRVYAQQLTAPFRLTARDMVWGHFSQLAVWTLRAVGCGAVRHGFEQTRMLLVCDFSHTNMLGQRTVTPGPLAPCPMLTMRRSRTAYPLLCAPVNKPKPSDKDDRVRLVKGNDYDSEEDIEQDEREEEEVRTTVSTRRTTRQHGDRIPQKFFRPGYFMSTKEGREVERRIELEKENLRYQEPIRSNRKTTQRLLDKFENGMETSRGEYVTFRKYQQWETRRPGLGTSNDESENYDYIAIVNTKNKLTHDNEEFKLGDEKPVTSRAGAISNHGLNSRHRWKQTRIRPQRPGANALLNKPPEKVIHRPSITPFLLDKDDSDQLFRDTGFNVHWRKQMQK